MKILNIHGYKGNSHNSAYKALKSLGYDVISPSLDYDVLAPEEIFETLCRQIIDNEADIIVGTSLGGFFAAVLSTQLNLPVILVNPCLTPFLYLPRLGYTKDIKPYIAMFGEILKLKKYNISTIIGGQDEIIDSHDFTKSLLSNERFEIIPEGKHSGETLPLKNYFNKILNLFISRHKISVSVYSRKEIEKIILKNKFPKNTAVISFYEPEVNCIDKNYKQLNYKGICDCVFYNELDDIDSDSLKDNGYSYDSYFPEADEIAEFIYSAYNMGMNIICQCEDGKSRSAGCAAAILEHFYHKGISIFADYKHSPNQLVYHKIFDALECYKKNH